MVQNWWILKTTHSVILFIWNERRQIYSTENRLEGFWSWGYERIDCKHAYRIFLKHCKTVLKLEHGRILHGNGVKFYTFLKNRWIIYLKWIPSWYINYNSIKLASKSDWEVFFFFFKEQKQQNKHCTSYLCWIYWA